jgi:ribosomal protein S18 acetylase RimI-like enzyme
VRPHLEIRPATVSDIDAVLSVWRQSGAHRTVTDDEQGVALLITEASGALLVAVDSGAVVGTGIAGWNGWRGSIYRIAVDPAHRRSLPPGIARAS